MSISWELEVGSWKFVAKAFCITSLSSELEVLAKVIFGNKACNSSSLLVSDFEPVIEIADCRLQIADCNSKFIFIVMSYEL
jgi:hypothetical protein